MTPIASPVALGEAAAARFIPERTFADLVPNTKFSIDGKAAAPLDSGIVVGKVSSVDPGKAYGMPGGDAPSGTEVPFDSKDAVWRIMIATIEVDTAVGQPLAQVKQIRVGLPVNGDVSPKEFSAGVLAMGRVIAVIGPQGIYDFDKTLYQVYRAGVFLAPVNDQGAFTFGALGPDASKFQAGIDTVAEVTQQYAQKPAPATATIDPSKATG